MVAVGTIRLRGNQMSAGGAACRRVLERGLEHDPSKRLGVPADRPSPQYRGTLSWGTTMREIERQLLPLDEFLRPWQDQSACRAEHSELFFPARSERASVRVRR